MDIRKHWASPKDKRREQAAEIAARKAAGAKPEPAPKPATPSRKTTRQPRARAS